MIWVYLALTPLAAYRVWRLLAIDEITWPVRKPLIESNNPVAEWATSLLLCPWCLGAWLSLAFVVGGGVALGASFHPIMWAALWLSCSTLTGLLGQLDKGTGMN